MSFTISDKKTGKSVTFTKKPYQPKMDIRGQIGQPKLAVSLKKIALSPATKRTIASSPEFKKRFTNLFA